MYDGTMLVDGLLPDPLRELVDAVSGADLGNAAWALAIALGALILGRVVASLALSGLARWAKRTENQIDDSIATHLTRPIRWLLPLIALQIVMPVLGLSQRAEDGIQHALLVLIIVGAGWFTLKIVRVLEDAVSRRFDPSAEDNLAARSVQTQVRVFHNLAVFVVSLLTLGFVLMTFEGVRQVGAGLLASAGVAGIVIGFAAQRSIATIFAGIQLALSQPIRIDDVVVVEGEWGRIEEIHLTYVVVRIWDLRRLVVPVSYFIDKPFQNWTRTSAEVLGAVLLHCDYRVPVAELREQVRSIVEGSELWDGQVWSVQVTDSNDKTMLVRALFSAKNASDQWNLRCELREKLIGYLQEHHPDSLPRVRAEIAAR